MFNVKGPGSQERQKINYSLNASRFSIHKAIALDQVVLVFWFWGVLFVCLFVLVFQDRVSLYSPGCAGTHSFLFNLIAGKSLCPSSNIVTVTNTRDTVPLLL